MFFSELIKREITKLMLVIFIHNSISPAFAMEGMPEYVVNVEQRPTLNPTTLAPVMSYFVNVQKRMAVAQTAMAMTAIAQTAYAYQTIFDQVVAPFIVATAYTATQMTAMVRLTEILQTVKANVEKIRQGGTPLELSAPKRGAMEEADEEEEEQDDAPLDIPDEVEPLPLDPTPKEVETPLSRGYHLSIPGLGDLLLSHDGDIVLSASDTALQNLAKSLKVISPGRVILDNVRAGNIEVEATSAFLTDGKKASFEEISFRSTGVIGSLENGLFISEGAELEVGKLSIENALVANAGLLRVKRELGFDGGALLNSGVISTTADPTTISGLSYLLNGKDARIEASGRLILGSDSIDNFGRVSAKRLSITTSETFENTGAITGSEELEVLSIGGFSNRGTLESKRLIIGSDADVALTGTVRTTESLSVTSKSRVGILGSVSGNSGVIKVVAPVIVQDGQTTATKIDLSATESMELIGDVGSQELFLTSKSITSKKQIQTQRGVVSGSFYGSGRLAFERQLELDGDETKFVATTVETAKLINRGKKTTIVGGEFTTTTEVQNTAGSLVFNDTKLHRLTILTNAGSLGFSAKSETPLLAKITSKGELFFGSSTPMPKVMVLDLEGSVTLESSLPSLEKLTVRAGGSVVAKTAMPRLKHLENHGTVKITADVVSLESVTNMLDASETQVEANAPLPLFRNLTLTKGKFYVKAAMPNLVSVTVQKGATFSMMEGGSASTLSRIQNSGTASFSVQLTTLESIFNDAEAVLHLLDDTVVKGPQNETALDELARMIASDVSSGKKKMQERSVSPYRATQILTAQIIALHCKDDSFTPVGGHSDYQAKMRGLISKTVAENDGVKILKKVGVTNAGHMTVKHNYKRSSSDDHYDLDVKGTYYATKTGVLHYENGAHTLAEDYINHGVLHSSSRFRVVEHGTCTKWGKAIAKDGIVYEVDRGISLGSMTLKPVIRDQEKGTFKIQTKGHAEIDRDLIVPYKVEIEAPSFNIRSKFLTGDLKIKTGSLSLQRGGIIDSDASVFIDAQTFSSNGGKIRANHGIKFMVSGTFTNYGGQSSYNDTPWNFRQKADNFYEETRLAYGEPVLDRYGRWAKVEARKSYVSPPSFTKYSLSHDLAGFVGCGGDLEIDAGSIANDFGVLRASGLIRIKSNGDIGNRCGVIYSETGTDLRGRNLYNGYAESSHSMDGGVNPNAPLYDRSGKRESVRVKEATRVLVREGHYERTGSRHLGIGRRRQEWYDPVYRDVPAEYKDIFHDVIIGFERYGSLYASTSASPGFIFVDKVHGPGHITINMTGNVYSGVTVAAGNIFYKGQTLTGSRTIGGNGQIIAGGNIRAEVQKYAFKQMVMQAMDIFLSQTEDFNFGEGYYKGKDEEKPRESGTQAINLRKFLEQTSGLLARQAPTVSVYAQTPWKLAPGLSPSMVYTMPSANVGYTSGLKPPSAFSRVFPTVHPQTVIQSLNYILTSLYGNKILLSLDIRSELEGNGAQYAATHSTHNIVLREEDNPMMLYDWAGQKTQTLVDAKTGENVIVAAVDPILICAMYSKMAEYMTQANRFLSMKTRGRATFRPGEYEFQAPHVSVEADEELFVRGTLARDIEGRDEYRPAFLSADESLELNGRLGVTIQGSVVSSKSLKTHSELGDDRRIDAEGYDRHWVEDGVFYSSTTKIPSTIVADTYESSAPKGTSLDVGTHMKVGSFGASGERYEARSSREEVTGEYDKSRGRRRVDTGKIESERLQPTVIQADRRIHFSTTSASLRGTKLVTPNGEVIDDTHHMEMGGDIGRTSEYHHKSKRSFWRKSDFREWIDREFLEPTTIEARSFHSSAPTSGTPTGKGDLVLRSVRAKIGEMTVTKNLSETAQHLESRTKVVQKSSGFFGPRLKMDPLVDAFKGLVHMKTIGDAVPTMANVVGATAQTLTHAKILSNLSVLGSPTANILNIGLGRFVVGPSFGSTKRTVTVEESRAVPSTMDIGVLKISNDRTHIEGAWKMDRGYIDTGRLEVVAPKSTIRSTSRTSGWRLTLGSAIFSTVLGMSNPLSALPSISTTSGEEVTYQETFEPTSGIQADQLVIKVNDALFSGVQVEARLMELLATGQVTVESLRTMFESHRRDESFNVSLAALSSCFTESKVSPSMLDPRFGAIPSVRIAKESVLRESIDRMARAVGRERFLAKVAGTLCQHSGEFGLLRDGYAVPTGATEDVAVGQRFQKDLELRSHHKRHVINPGFSEVFGAFQQIREFTKTSDEINQIRAKIAQQKALENATQAEKVQTDKEVKEFFDKPDVSSEYEKLKVAQAKMKIATAKMAILEEENPGLQGDSEHLAELRTAMSGRTLELSTLSEYMTAREEQQTLYATCLDAASSLREKAEVYGASNAAFDRVKYGVLQGIGYATMAGTLTAAAVYGGLPALIGTGGMMWASNEVMAAVIEHGAESFIESAASQGRTEAESERFGRTAVWVVDSILTGASAIGVTKMISNRAAILSKVKTLKTNIAAVSKRAFSRKQTSPVKVDTTSLESIASAIEKAPTVMIQQEKYRGGAYKDVKKAPKPGGTEAHHIPARSIPGTSTEEGPAIQMAREDHMKTSSWGSSHKAQEYRALQEQKINSCEARGVYATEFWDIRRGLLIGTKTKYNEAFRQMLDYGKSNGFISTK